MTTITEVWKSVQGCPGYEVSNLARFKGKYRVLNQQRKYRVSVNGEKKIISLRRAVYTAFVGDIPDDYVVGLKVKDMGSVASNLVLRPKSWPTVDLTGRRFGRLVAVRPSHQVRSGEWKWVFKCDCGRERVERHWQLMKVKLPCCSACKKRPDVRSLSMGKERAFVVKHKCKFTHRVWQKMKDRCQNPNHTHYNRYGGRGILIEWDSFGSFFRDVGHRPVGKVLLRRDIDGNYNKNNCYWGTIAEGNQNRSSVKRMELNGQTKSVTQWAREYNVDRHLVYKRLDSGWDLERALTYEGRNSTKSVGEDLIESFLETISVDFLPQWYHPTCKDKGPLRFDFLVRPRNLFERPTLIEYDGKQHFASIKHFGGDQGLADRQRRDEIKNKWAVANNHSMIRIPYTEQGNIETILKNHFGEIE